MKRLIAAAILIVIVIGICFGSSILMDRICAHSEELLTKAVGNIDNRQWVQAAKQSKSLQHYWEEKQSLMAAFANHGDLDEIAEMISTLAPYAEEQNENDFRSTVSAIRYRIARLLEEQEFNPERFL